jgi:hypothetical protein
MNAKGQVPLAPTRTGGTPAHFVTIAAGVVKLRTSAELAQRISVVEGRP